MPLDDPLPHKIAHLIRETVIYTIYAIAVYRIANDLSDDALSLYLQNKWYKIKSSYNSEKQIQKDTGKVIFEAMEVMENER